MLFLGNGFFGGKQPYTSTNIDNFTKIELMNHKIDDLFITKDADASEVQSTKKWDYNTILYAMFGETLLAGNLLSSIETISSILVKQREIGTVTWKTIYDIKITEAKDFQFSKAYRYCKGNETKYEFALVPIINGVEGEYFKNDVVSAFEGFYLTEKDVTYQLILNTEFSIIHNKPTSTITTLGRKKPFYISNGISQFDSGSITATFIPKNWNNKGFDLKNANVYRSEVNKFLHNGKPKVLKHFDGRMWIVNIDSSISEDSKQYYEMPVHTINWTEIGEIDNMDDLFDNGFIDTDYDSYYTTRRRV